MCIELVEKDPYGDLVAAKSFLSLTWAKKFAKKTYEDQIKYIFETPQKLGLVLQNENVVVVYQYEQ